MSVSFLADENFRGYITRRLVADDVDIVRAQDVGLYAEPDPVVLRWAAEEGRVTLSHDFGTLPHYAYERARTGLAMPGVVMVPQSIPAGQAISDIHLLSECSLEGEFEGQVLYLPL
ncbi:MAG: hypothetical protein F4Y49_13645 [Dehalococcoidia bacterium]|nr:hypothetical protein [Dehalococcoidia bacterium]